MTIKETQKASKELGLLLDIHAIVGQKQFKRQLEEVRQNKQLSLKSVINCPIKHYKNRTCVHLAAAYNLSECLEMLLKNGGKFSTTPPLTVIFVFHVSHYDSKAIALPCMCI